MNLDELAQPPTLGQKPRILKLLNIATVIVTNAGDGAHIQLDGIREHVYAVNLQPGDRVRLDLIEPTAVRFIEG